MSRVVKIVPMAAAAALGMGLLTGCGAGEDLRVGGVAAEMADRTITLDRVDTITDALCATWVAGGNASQVAPRRVVETEILARLVRGAMVDSVGAGRDSQPNGNQSDIPGWTDLTEDEQDALWTFYVDDAGTTEALAALGGGSTGSEEDDSSAAGEEALADRVRERGVDVTLNPRFGLSVDDGALVGAPDLSVAVSDLAAASDDPDLDYLRSLPASQVCGPKPTADMLG